MKNFSKSVLYSTAVLAVGLVGIFTIYNNVEPSNDGISMASIAPASGQSDLGVNFGEALEDSNYVFEDVTYNATDIMESSASELNDLVSAAGGDVSEMVDTTIETATDAAKEVTEKVENISDTLLQDSPMGAMDEAAKSMMQN